jgi:N-acetylglucosamine-6-phosphate deacetylase
MPTTAIYASRILTPQDEINDGVILVEEGRISAIGHRDEVRVPDGSLDYVATAGSTVVPGFVDIHIHGAGGHDVMEGTSEALDCVTSTVARYGTTSMLATTVTAPIEETCQSLQGIARYIRNQQQPQETPRLAAEILGMHLEGPFISKKQPGVHPLDSITKPSVEILEQFFKAADGLVRILTLAPEVAGAAEMIRAAVASGVVAAMGHTDANYEQAQAAVQAGVRHAVHTFNAMRPFTHRDPGVLAAIMTDVDVTAEIIADGVHVAGPAIQVLLGCKGFDTVLLISDGVAATGMPDGTYRLGTTEAIVENGVARNSQGKLAGSTLTLDRALRNMVALGVPMLDALRMATVLPARRLGLAGKKGILAIGADADIVVLTSELRVEGVMIRGVGLI